MPEPDDWTPAAVEAELRAALVTLRRLPSKHLMPAGIRVAWPAVLRTYAESYGYDRAQRPRMQATAEDIRRMDMALGWVWEHLHSAACERAGLVVDTAQILLMRAAHLSWEDVAQYRLERWVAPRHTKRGPQQAIPGGNSINSLRKHHRAGVARIVEILTGAAPAAPAPRPPREEWGVQVEVARPGEALDEGSYGPVHARARWGLVRR